MALSVMAPPPLQPHTPIRLASMYGPIGHHAANRRRLVGGRQDADLPVDRAPPRATARRGGATAVDAGDEVASLRQHQVPQMSIAAPAIHDGLPGGLRIDVHQQRIFLRRRRNPAASSATHPAPSPPISTLKNSAGARRARERASACGSCPRCTRTTFVGGQPHDIDRRRSVRGGRRYAPPTSRRERCRSRECRPARRREAFDFRRASQRGAIEISLRDVVGRGDEVGVAAFVVDRLRSCTTSNSPGVRRSTLLSVARHDVQVHPAVALAEPGECAAAVQPAHVVARHQPRRLGLDHDGRAAPVAASPSSTRFVFWRRFSYWISTSPLPAQSMRGT